MRLDHFSILVNDFHQNKFISEAFFSFGYDSYNHLSISKKISKFEQLLILHIKIYESLNSESYDNETDRIVVNRKGFNISEFIMI